MEFIIFAIQTQCSGSFHYAYFLKIQYYDTIVYMIYMRISTTERFIMCRY